MLQDLSRTGWIDVHTRAVVAEVRDSSCGL
jgi:hypothetical protein